MRMVSRGQRTLTINLTTSSCPIMCMYWHGGQDAGVHCLMEEIRLMYHGNVSPSNVTYLLVISDFIILDVNFVSLLLSAVIAYAMPCFPVLCTH